MLSLQSSNQLTKKMEATKEAIREGYQGMMTKRIIDMTPDERKAYYEQGARIIRERLFAIGQPFVTKKGDKVVAEYADGRVEIVR